MTLVSRLRHFELLPPKRGRLDEIGPLGYCPRTDWPGLEPDLDIHALFYDFVVSVAPVSLDLSSRVDRATLERLLRCTH